jgi:uncharacterized protein (TIGR01777 family)
MITGGTGTIGTALTESLLKRDFHVIVLSRNSQKKTDRSGLSYAYWDPEKMKIEEKAVQAADYIIHLAGAGVADERWSEKRKKEIHDSRVNGGRLLVHALENIPNNVKCLVSSSAIGWYGPDPSIPNPSPFAETDPSAPGFLGDTCKDWEASIHPLESKLRLVILRIGIVLSDKGGALTEFKKPLRFRGAAILGNGKQIVSWIHVDDLADLFIFAMENSSWKGIYNAVAPSPVSNKELTLSLAKANGGFYIPFYVPAFLLKIIMGEMSIEVLKSATVSSVKAEKQGFQFRFRNIDEAMKDLLKRN